MTILFDLDGTLFDTSYDLYTAVNQLLVQDGLPKVDYNLIRDEISHGSKKILAQAYGISDPDSPQQAKYMNSLFLRYLQIYEATKFKHTQTFPGIDELLTKIEKENLRWGIVTNRRTALTMPLLANKGYDTRTGCVVCADTLNISKPSPEPLRHACKLMSVEPSDCIYIGDALTDVQAGKAAGMSTMVAAFGYVPRGVALENWQADYVVHSANEIYPHLEKWLGK